MKRVGHGGRTAGMDVDSRQPAVVTYHRCETVIEPKYMQHRRCKRAVGRIGPIGYFFHDFVRLSSSRPYNSMA